MANPGETSSPEIRCMFVETSLDSRLALLVHKDEIISDFKEKLAKEHKQVFPEIGEINVSALKVKRGGKFYHFSESMNVSKAFDGISSNWFMHVDAVRVEKVDQTRLNLELVEKKKEIAVGSVLVDGMDTKDLTLEEGLETEVVEKKIRKRKVRSSDGQTSRKKSKVDVNQSAVATTELSGKVVQGEVASQSCGVSPREKVDDILTDAAIGKVIESGERNDADMLSEGRILTVNSELVDGHTKGEVKDVPDSQTDDLPGAIEHELVDGKIASRDDERGEGIRLAPSTVDNLQTAVLVTDAEKQLDASSGLTTGTATETKRKRPKSSKHQISRSTAGATTTSRKTVDEINVVPGTVASVDAISKSCPISDRETLGNPLVEAVQKETEMGEKSVEDAGRDTIKTDNLASHPENHLEANSGLTTAPVTEKKKRQKKSSKDHISQPAAIATAAAATTSTENVNETKAIKKKIRGSSKPQVSQASQSQASQSQASQISLRD